MGWTAFASRRPCGLGPRWRGVAEIAEVSEIRGGVQAKVVATAEIERSEGPAVVAEYLVRFYA
jgi:hypothetical protein